MSVTIEEVMSLIEASARTGRARGQGLDVIRAALSALVAQARDEEAEACAEIAAPETIPFSDTEWAVRCEIAEGIRARIAGRKDGGART